MTDTTTEMLALADRIAAIEPWTAQIHPQSEKYERYVTVLTKDQRELIVSALRASTGAYVEGQRSMQERAVAAAMSVGQPVGAGDGCGTYIPGTSADAARAIASLPLQETQESDGGVESKTGRPDRSPLEYAAGVIPEGGHKGETGQDALAGFARADKSAQPTVSNDRIPEQPETAYATDRQIAGVAPGPSDPSSTRSEVTVGDFAGWCESNGYFASVSFIRALLDQFEIRRK